MAYNITYLNQIVADLGGSDTYIYEIDALNAICTLLGITAGHKYKIDALNTIDVNQGGLGGHKYNIEALNSIIMLAGETGGYKYEPDAWAVIQQGALLNQALEATLTSTGTGAGVSTLRMEVSENQTLEITSGTARFYTDAAGTLGESTMWNVTAGGLHTIYLKAPSGDSVLNIPKPDKVIKCGNSTTDGWISSTNAARISIEVGKLALTDLRIIGTSTLTGALPTDLNYLRLDGNSISWTYTGALPIGLTYLFLSGNSISWTYTGALPIGLKYLILGNSISWTYTGALPIGLTYLLLSGNSISWTYTGALPTGLTYLYLFGNLMNWTGLNVGNNGNISTFTLANYRTDKMSSPDMVTLLTQLTNRTGSLPTTITINDYADYASPPQAVTDAVAALKIAKSITTVNLGA